MDSHEPRFSAAAGKVLLLLSEGRPHEGLQLAEKSSADCRDCLFDGTGDCLALHGYCYALGYGTRMNRRAAIKKLKDSSKQGSQLGKVLLAFALHNNCRAKSVASAVTVFDDILAMCDGCGELKAIAAYAIINGKVTKDVPGSNDDMAWKYARESADGGSYYGISRAGFCLQHGIGVEKDLKEAAQCYHKAAKNGNLGIAQYNLALLYAQGLGVEKNKLKAFEYYAYSAQQGFMLGLFTMAILCLHGVPDLNLSKDEARGVMFLRDAANQGHGDSLFRLGVCLAQGVGIKRDRNKASQCFVASAKAGVVNGMYNAGLCFELGTGVPKDMQKAAKWYALAAEKGSPYAQKKLQGLEDN